MNHLGDIAKMMLRVRIRLRVDRVVIAGVGMLDDGHGIAQQRGVESLQPVDTRIGQTIPSVCVPDASSSARCS